MLCGQIIYQMDGPKIVHLLLAIFAQTQLLQLILSRQEMEQPTDGGFMR